MYCCEEVREEERRKRKLRRGMRREKYGGGVGGDMEKVKEGKCAERPRAKATSQELVGQNAARLGWGPNLVNWGCGQKKCLKRFLRINLVLLNDLHDILITQHMIFPASLRLMFR